MRELCVPTVRDPLENATGTSGNSMPQLQGRGKEVHPARRNPVKFGWKSKIPPKTSKNETFRLDFYENPV